MVKGEQVYPLPLSPRHMGPRGLNSTVRGTTADKMQRVANPTALPSAKKAEGGSPC